MKVRLSAPSKTFLLGEYFVLQGGSALVLSTKPRFTLNAENLPAAKKEDIIYGVHPSSPAGRYFAQNEFFKKWRISFEDPHNALGGFGASGAQFLLLFCLGEMIQTGEFTDNDSSEGGWPQFAVQPGFLKRLWETYQEFSEAGSGADVLAQLAGKVTAVQIPEVATVSGTRANVSVKPREAATEVLDWPFAHYGFALVRTGRKVATHNHLKSLKAVDVTTLGEILKSGRQSFENENAKSFIEAVNAYQESLQSLGLVAPESLELIEALQATEAVAAVKGCGALGADVLFVMYKNEKESIVRDRLNLLNLPIVATLADLSCGLKTTVEAKSRAANAGRGSKKDSSRKTDEAEL